MSDITALSLELLWTMAQQGPYYTTPEGGMGKWERGPDGSIIHHRGTFPLNWGHIEAITIPEVFTWDRFTGVQFRLTFTDQDSEFQVILDGPVKVDVWWRTHFIGVVVRITAGGVTRTKNFTAFGCEYLRISRNQNPYYSTVQDDLSVEFSIDGVNWDAAATFAFQAGDVDLDASPYSVYYKFTGGVELKEIHGVTMLLPNTLRPADILEFNDDFNDGVINPTFWPAWVNWWGGSENFFETTAPTSCTLDSSQPAHTVDSGNLHFADHHADNDTVGEFLWPYCHGVQLDANWPGLGGSFFLSFQGQTHPGGDPSETTFSIYVTFGPTGVSTTLDRGNGTSTDDGLSGAFRYVRIYRNRYWHDGVPGGALGRWADHDFFYVDASTDGATWQRVAAQEADSDDLNGPYSCHTEMNGHTSLNEVMGITVPPTPQGVIGGGGGSTKPNPNPTPPIWDPPEAPDPFNPNALMKDEDEGKATLLELVRAFSSAVRRAVRITGATRIEMVDPTVPLPAGWHDADAPDMYVNAGRSAAAATEVLSIRAGDVTLTAAAQWKKNDVRVLNSTWRIPDKLPLYGLPPAPVQRVSITFSPQAFTASMDFHYASVPLEVKQGIA